MAGSRVEKVGTIFSRLTGLIRSGSKSWEDRPLWYDVYSAFPPKTKPSDAQISNEHVRSIFYAEDAIRAKFYKEFNSPGVIHMSSEEKYPSLCQRFVEKYLELAKSGGTKTEKELFAETKAALEAEGVVLRRWQPSTKTTTSPPERREKFDVTSL